MDSKMKATSIEQIYEHLEQGGRVLCHRPIVEGYEPQVYEVYGAINGMIAISYMDQKWMYFDSAQVDYWELLPIEEGKQQPDPLSELSENKRWAAIRDIAKHGNEWFLESCRLCYSSSDLRLIAEELDLRNARENVS